MWKELISLDVFLFQLLNGLGAPYLDEPMRWISNKYIWIPLYLWLAYKIYLRYHRKIGTILALVGVLIIATDRLSSGVLKPVVKRLRPCHSIKAHARILKGVCGGKYGFVSSHAANGFGLAAFMGLLPGVSRRTARGLYLWAGLNAYSRVYLGVHYPADVVCGGAVGVVCGYGVYYTTKKWHV